MSGSENLPTTGFGRLTLLFFGISIFLLAIVGTYSQGRFQEETDRRNRQFLEEKLDLIVTETSPTWYPVSRLRNFIRLVRLYGPNAPQVAQAHRQLEQEEALPLHAYFFINRRLVGCLPANAPEKEFTGRVFPSLFLQGQAFREEQFALSTDLASNLGPGTRLELLLRLKGKIRRFSLESGRKAFYWDEFPDGIGVFFILPSDPTFEERMANFRRKDHPWGGSAFPEQGTWDPPAGLASEAMELAWLRSQNEGTSVVPSGDHQWLFCQNREGRVLCVVQPVAETPDHSAVRWLVFGGYGLACGFWFLLLFTHLKMSFGLQVETLLESFTIRGRLFSLFAMATVLPIGMGLILGSITLQDRREALITESQKESLERIHNLDKIYKVRLQDFHRLSQALRNSPAVQQARITELSELINRLHDRDELQQFDMRDEKGQLIYTNMDPRVHGVSQAAELFSKVAIRRLAPNRMGAAIDTVTPGELISETILNQDNFGMASMLRKRGQLWEFRMGTLPAIWYFDVFPELATGPACLSMVHQLEWIYSKALLAALSRSPAPGKPFQGAIEISEEACSLQIYPNLKGSQVRRLLQALIRSHETGRVLFRELPLEDDRYWVTIKPEVTLAMWVLFDLVPVEGRLRTLAPFRWRLATTAGLALLLSFLGATLIARLFLLPIGDLAGGIAAIRRRDDTFRIPIRRPDEFGALAGAFNRVLGELKELQYGRIVQESLLPADPPPLEGYEIAFLRCTANDLAGDYHDVFPAPDGKWVFLLGDVTGHGISAALAMAMAKATVDYQLLKGSSFPTEAMDQLNALFYRELKPRQKFMTLACLVLDPVTHHTMFENAGHPYPYHYHAETRDITEMHIPSLPLGSRKKRRQEGFQATIEPGDAILLFTDGLVECQDASGALFGYPRLQTLFATMMARKTPLQDAAHEINRALDAFRVPGPPSDDMTFVIFRRIP